jgi:hypothetical protein
MGCAGRVQEHGNAYRPARPPAATWTSNSDQSLARRPRGPSAQSVQFTSTCGQSTFSLNPVFLTPGLVIGRFRLADNLPFTFGARYQFAITPDFRPTPLTPGL